jgi:hypothetical protein
MNHSEKQPTDPVAAFLSITEEDAAKIVREAGTTRENRIDYYPSEIREACAAAEKFLDDKLESLNSSRFAAIREIVRWLNLYPRSARRKHAIISRQIAQHAARLTNAVAAELFSK